MYLELSSSLDAHAQFYYGVLMKPYLERMRVLQKQVDKRILYGRDNKGKGSSTFKKRQFHHVLKEIETM